MNAGKVLSSFTFLYMTRGIEADDAGIAAATLEANDTTATGTITGRVVGRPLTNTGGTIAPEADTRALPGAMVVVDALHAVYTDDSGNFTLPNVPLGAQSIKVIPYATGIVSKTFPLTVVSGANPMNDVNVGAGVTEISAVLGPTNTENGLRQVEGNPVPYELSGSRPGVKYTITDSATTPLTIAGKTARLGQVGTGSTNQIYFQVDPGWLHMGRMGNLGLDPASLGAPTAADSDVNSGRLAPDIYMAIEYLDRNTDNFNVQYNRMTGERHSSGSITYRMTDSYRTIQRYTTPATPGATTAWNVTKTNTGQWKTAVYEFKGLLTSPVPAGTFAPAEPFGAWKGQNLSADFRINPDSNPASGPAGEIIHKVTLSVNPIVIPRGAKDVLRYVGGLQAATPADISALDQNSDGRLTIIDAAILTRLGRP